jgi:hypothetical protein
MQAHGGSLVLYNMSSGCSNQGAGLEQGEPGLVVAPLGGRLLLFESHLEHEVLPAHRHRYSITTWFYDDVVEAGPPAAGPSSSSAPARNPNEASSYSALDSSNRSSSHDTSMTGTPGVHAANQETNNPQEQQTTQSAVDPLSAAATAAAVAAAAAAAAAAGGGGGGGGMQLAEQLQATELLKQPRMLPRVLVCIASLRDPETRWTLRDVFVQAAAPERVFVAVAWQVDEEADAGLMRMAGGARSARFASQVSRVTVSALVNAYEHHSFAWHLQHHV